MKTIYVCVWRGGPVSVCRAVSIMSFRKGSMSMGIMFSCLVGIKGKLRKRENFNVEQTKTASVCYNSQGRKKKPQK